MGTLAAVARHEAAHAVAAVLLGVPVISAVVIGGRAELRGQVRTGRAADPWHDALICAAGMALDASPDAGHDRQHLVELVGGWAPAAVDAAGRLLRPHAAKVDAVARELLARRYLSGRDVADLLAARGAR